MRKAKGLSQRLFCDEFLWFRLAGITGAGQTWAATTLDVELLEFGPDFKPPVANTRAELLQMFDAGVADARQKISAASDVDWQKTWTLKFSGQTILSMPRIEVMRSTVMNHMIHHRAQLGVYLRLNNVAIPGMYGPSADEANPWEAKGTTAG